MITAEQAATGLPSRRESPQETYVKLLLPHRQGYPLWVPEPDENLPKAYQARGVSIGDLGYISDSGGFIYLFNICEAADHEVNAGRTPEDFRRLHFDPINGVVYHSQMHKPNTDISSVHMRKSRAAQGGLP
jgi:hypothetical protein